MRLLTAEEARVWCQSGVVRLDSDGLPVRPSVEVYAARRPLPREISRLTWFCRHVEQSLRPRDTCLLWVTDWGVWRTSENLHLYYQLRGRYGDLRLLHEAPAHLFLEYEAADLVSFLQVGVLCGWDMHLVPTASYTRAFVSHDEWVEFAADENNPHLVEEFVAQLDRHAGSRE